MPKQRNKLKRTEHTFHESINNRINSWEWPKKTLFPSRHESFRLPNHKFQRGQNQPNSIGSIRHGFEL